MRVLETFSGFVTLARKAKKKQPLTDCVLLALDPGETTGWTVLEARQGQIGIRECGQAKTWEMPFAVASLSELLTKHKPTFVVHELYAVYEWKAEDHSWSSVPTLRVIGCLETLCIQRGLPYGTQTAQIAKNFCTDDKLKGWQLYVSGQRHARDAIRHGCYWMAFGQ